jgi:hypothetical protein
MTTYTVYFRTDAQFASDDIEADTPEQALALARELSPRELWFDPYDSIMPVNKIVVSDPDGEEVADWLDDDLHLRLAAYDMLAALEAQEMAEADPEAGRRKGYFDHAREMRKAAITKAKGGAA